MEIHYKWIKFGDQKHSSTLIGFSGLWRNQILLRAWYEVCLACTVLALKKGLMLLSMSCQLVLFMAHVGAGVGVLWPLSLLLSFSPTAFVWRRRSTPACPGTRRRVMSLIRSGSATAPITSSCPRQRPSLSQPKLPRRPMTSMQLLPNRSRNLFRKLRPKLLRKRRRFRFRKIPELRLDRGRGPRARNAKRRLVVDSGNASFRGFGWSVLLFLCFLFVSLSTSPNCFFIPLFYLLLSVFFINKLCF